MRKIVRSIERERNPWNFENQTEGSGIEFGSVPVPSRIQRDPMKKKREKRRKKKRKKRSSWRESDGGVKPVGKRMGFNIAGSTEPDGDSYNGGARGLAKPYRLWVRDSTE